MKPAVTKIILPRDQDRLINFLVSDTWPFHVNNHLTTNKVTELIQAGSFDGSNHESFFILNEEEKEIGFIRLFDLDDVDDGYPMFDLRIHSKYRGQGFGKFAVQWLTKYLFSKHPNLERIAGTTRADNTSMRKIFKASGYVKEGHYRKDWTVVNGESLDTVKYSILREDWSSGSTTKVNWHDDI